MRTFIAFLLALYLVFFAAAAFESFGEPQGLGRIAEHYAAEGFEEVGAINLVTAVVVTYRGLDTLGEVSVLFTAASAVILLLSVFPLGKPANKPSSIVLLTMKVLPGPILLFGGYIIAHGHLTPGGGFPGGAVVASAALLVLLGCTQEVGFAKWLTFAESMAGFSFAMLGFWGLLKLGQFLNNSVLFLGIPGQLLSAGIIPLISAAIGVKVASELSGILVAYRCGGGKE